MGLVLHFPAPCLESSGGLVSFPVDLKLMQQVFMFLDSPSQHCGVFQSEAWRLLFYGVCQLRTVELSWLRRCGTQMCYMSAYNAGLMWPTDPLTPEWRSALLAPRRRQRPMPEQFHFSSECSVVCMTGLKTERNISSLSSRDLWMQRTWEALSSQALICSLSLQKKQLLQDVQAEKTL